MNAYRQYVTIDEAKKVILSDLPFNSGQRIEIIIIVDDNSQKKIKEPNESLKKETTLSNDELDTLAGTWTEADEIEFYDNSLHFREIEQDLWKSNQFY